MYLKIKNSKSNVVKYILYSETVKQCISSMVASLREANRKSYNTNIMDQFKNKKWPEIMN